MNESIKAHLRACRDCRDHSDETASLLALLKAQPRVEAPADFDFKLRARIASIELAPRTPWAALESFLTRSFSWGQAITATATLAVLATFSAIYFTNSGERVISTPDIAAATVSTQKSDPVALTGATETASAPEAAIPAKPIAARFGAKSVRIAPASIKAAEIATSKVQVAGDDSWRGYNSANGHFVSAPTRDLIGAEGSSSRMAKAAAFVPSI
jgi:hypothetical protein